MQEDTTMFDVEGLKCGGCEAAAKAAVTAVPGCVEAIFDHKTGSGRVTGSIDPRAVIEALAHEGYTARLAQEQGGETADPKAND